MQSIRWPRIRPDGREVAFAADGSTWVTPSDTWTPRLLLDHEAAVEWDGDAFRASVPPSADKGGAFAAVPTSAGGPGSAAVPTSAGGHGSAAVPTSAGGAGPAAVPALQRRLVRGGEVVYEDDEHAVRWTLPGQRWRGFDLFVQDHGGGVSSLMGIHADTRELAWLSPQGELSMDAIAVLDDDTLLVTTTMGRAFASVARFSPDARECAFLFDEGWDQRGTLLGDRLLVISNEAGADVARMYAWPSLLALPFDAPRGGGFGEVCAAGSTAVTIWESPRHSPVLMTLGEDARALSPMPAAVGEAPRQVRFPADDGEPLWGWLLMPPAPTATVVWLHDEGQARYRWRPALQALVSDGLAVFAPNVRGSSGFGLPYQRAALRRFGVDPRDDVAAAVRWAATEFGTERVMLDGNRSLAVAGVPWK